MGLSSRALASQLSPTPVEVVNAREATDTMTTRPPRILTCLGATAYTAMAILHVVLIASSGMISALIDTAMEAARAVALFGVAVPATGNLILRLWPCAESVVGRI